MYNPNYESILNAGIYKLNDSKSDLDLICTSFTNTFGPFIQQSVTLSYDFILNNDRKIEPKINRTKIDISCQFVKNDKFHLLLPFIIDLHEKWKLDHLGLKIFLKDMLECFGGSEIQYLSFGFIEGLDQVTVYAKPKGFNQ
jgi:hypothetical protein